MMTMTFDSYAERVEFFKDALLYDDAVKAIKEGAKQIKIRGQVLPFQFEELARILKNNKTLISLDIRNTGVSERSARILAQALDTNTTLTSIDYRYNPMSEEGADLLDGAVGINKSILRSRSESNHVIATSLLLIFSKNAEQGSKLFLPMEMVRTILDLSLSVNNKKEKVVPFTSFFTPELQPNRICSKDEFEKHKKKGEAKLAKLESSSKKMCVIMFVIVWVTYY